MSDTNHSRFDELLSLYLDASLGYAEEIEFLQLLSDQSLAARFHDTTKLNSEIAGLLAGSMPDEAMVDLVLSDLGRREDPLSSAETAPPKATVPIRTRAATPVPVTVRRESKKDTSLLLALAAMVVCFLVVSAVYYFHGSTPAIVRDSVPAAESESAPAVVSDSTPAAVPESTPAADPDSAPAIVPNPAALASAQITSVRGEVYFNGPFGQVSLTADQPLKDDGTIKTVGPDSRATFALPDGTQIELMGDTSFSEGFVSGKPWLYLNQGIIRASVVKQPENTPLVFNTVEATATVRGTELALIEQNLGTYLVVTKGAVALQHSTGGPEVLIKAGNYGHIEEDGDAHPFPIARLPKALQDEVLNEK